VLDDESTAVVSGIVVVVGDDELSVAAGADVVVSVD
jgi:hypothetical protein